MPKMKISETDELPKCPHCKKELAEILQRSKGFIGETVVNFCPHCKSVLGVGYGRGF